MVDAPDVISSITSVCIRLHVGIRVLLVNRIGAIRIFGGVWIYFPLAKQSVNFLQKELGSRNICTNFGESKRDVQQVKITQILSQRLLN
jgi:hypothetical protein